MATHPNPQSYVELVGGTPPEAVGTDTTGADGYATVLTPARNGGHLLVFNNGPNGATISIDAGTTDHFKIPGGTGAVLDSIQILSGIAIQAKNTSAGNNYTSLDIAIW